jgi:hypothetical protein
MADPFIQTKPRDVNYGLWECSVQLAAALRVTVAATSAAATTVT